jgi:hypothetical protein
MKPRSIIGTVSLFLLHPATAQEKPSLYIPEYNFNVTYRQNVCDRHQGYYNGSFELRDALEGFELHSLLTMTDYFRLDKNGAINENNPGLVPNILDELAKRGGFTWRNSFAVTNGPGDILTWTDLLAWATESYDVSADWWIHSIERIRMGVNPKALRIPAIFLSESRKTNHQIKQIFGPGQNRLILIYGLQLSSLLLFLVSCTS